MSGRRRGVFAGLLRGGLWIASWPYRWGVGHRNRGFDRGRREIHSCGVPVISVGNLTTGGTGKTPIVAFLARKLRAADVRVSIVSRGYGRGEADENDEAAELHQRLPDVPHVQDPDRVAAAQIAVDELETQLILMDDGFQHRRLHRDLDIVLVDLTCPFGFGYLLPRGLLREPIQNLRRADVVILTRCDQVTPAQIDQVIARMRSMHPELLILRSTHQPSGLLQFPDSIRPVSQLDQKRVALVSGIGNPDAFRRTVEDVGGIVVAEKQLPDHSRYDRDVVEQIKQWASGLADIDYLVCTQKDLVKLQTDSIGGKALLAVTIEASVEQSEALDEMLERLMELSRQV